MMRTSQRERRERDGHSEQAARVFALLLRFYPRAHRQAFGQQMLQTFQDHYRDAVVDSGESAPRFWLETLSDTGQSLVREYLAALTRALREGTVTMRTSVVIVLAVIAAILAAVGLRFWLSPEALNAPHGVASTLTVVTGLVALLLVYALVALGLPLARLGSSGPERAVAFQRATLLGALLGGGALVAITVETLGDAESLVSLAVWALVTLVAPICWGVVGLLATRAGSSWRLGLVAGLWSGMVTALIAAGGEVAITLLALPRLAQQELSNPDYMYWRQPDLRGYAIASALAVGVIGLILAPIAASIAGGIGSGLGKMAPLSSQFAPR